MGRCGLASLGRDSHSCSDDRALHLWGGAFNNSAPLGVGWGMGAPPTHLPWTPPPPAVKDWAKFSSSPLADQKFSIAPLAPISSDKKFSSALLAPLETQHHHTQTYPPPALLWGHCEGCPYGVWGLFSSPPPPPPS